MRPAGRAKQRSRAAPLLCWRNKGSLRIFIWYSRIFGPVQELRDTDLADTCP